MGLKKFIKRARLGLAKIFGRKKTKKLAAPRKRPRQVLANIDQNPPFLEAPREPSLPVVKALHAIDEFSGVQLSPHTQRAYKKDLQDFFAYLRVQGVWEHWYERVTPIVVSQYRMHLVRERGLSNGTVTRKLAVLKSFYKWSLARGWVRDNPAELVKSFPQTQESKTGFLNDPEVDRLLEHFPEVPGAGLGQALGKVVIESLLMLGVRRSEAVQIRAGDLEYLDERWLVRIHGKGDRGRTIPLPPRLVETWSDWFRRLSDETPVVALDQDPAGWIDWCRRNAAQPLLVSSRARSVDVALSSSELARIVRKSARRAGIVNRVSPHMLRATAITHALDQGASHRGVQQMAGWTSPLMISRYDKRRKDPRFSAVFHLRYAKARVKPEASVVL